MKSTNPLEAYRETQIKTASQGKLIVMLYDGAIKQLNLAIESFSQKHDSYDYISRCIIKTQDIVTELMVSLNFNEGKEIARNLFSLYLFVNRKLLDANVRKDVEPLRDVKTLLVELREAWAELARNAETEHDRTDERGVNIAG